MSVELDLDQIKDILDAFEERDMQKLELKKGDFELTLERSSKEMIQTSPYLPQMAMPPAHLNLPPAQGNLIENQPATPVEEAGRFITSPMVGTFYAASAPEEPAFAKVGDSVKEGQVVGIIEAMKVMNELKATESGTIKEVLVENGHPIEFGSKLFKIG